MSETQTIDPADDAPAPAAESEVETRARKMGWKPKEEYRGPPEAWRGAEEFVARGENELPVLRERYRSQEKKLGDLERQFAGNTAIIQDLTDRVRTADERAFKRLRVELVAKRDAAVAAGDASAFHRADAELREVDQTAPKPPPQRQDAPPTIQAGLNPDAAAWAARNPWFHADPQLHAAAISVHDTLVRTEPHLSVAENLDRVTESLRALYPGRFAAYTKPPTSNNDDNPRRAQAASVSGSTPGAGTARPNARSFANLPADAKTAYRRYAKQLEGKGKPLTEAEYAETYFEGED